MPNSEFEEALDKIIPRMSDEEWAKAPKGAVRRVEVMKNEAFNDVPACRQPSGFEKILALAAGFGIFGKRSQSEQEDPPKNWG